MSMGAIVVGGMESATSRSMVKWLECLCLCSRLSYASNSTASPCCSTYSARSSFWARCCAATPVTTPGPVTTTATATATATATSASTLRNFVNTRPQRGKPAARHQGSTAPGPHPTVAHDPTQGHLCHDRRRPPSQRPLHRLRRCDRRQQRCPGQWTWSGFPTAATVRLWHGWPRRLTQSESQKSSDVETLQPLRPQEQRSTGYLVAQERTGSPGSLCTNMVSKYLSINAVIRGSGHQARHWPTMRRFVHAATAAFTSLSE